MGLILKIRDATSQQDAGHRYYKYSSLYHS